MTCFSKYTILLLFLIFSACQRSNDADIVNALSQAFDTFQVQNDAIAIPDTAVILAQLRFYKDGLGQLTDINTDNLDTSTLSKYHALKTTFDKKLWEVSKLKAYEWKLSQYNYYTSLPTTVWSNPDLLINAPPYYEAMKAITQNTIPSEADTFIESHIKIYNDLKKMRTSQPKETLPLIDKNLLLIKDAIAYAVSLRNNTDSKIITEIQNTIKEGSQNQLIQ